MPLSVRARASAEIPRLPEAAWHRNLRRRRQTARGLVAAARYGGEVPPSELQKAREILIHHGTAPAMAGAWHKVTGRHNANAWKCTTCSGGGFNFWVRPNKDNCPQCQAAYPFRPKLFKDSADAGGGSNGWSKNGSGDSKAQKQQQRIKDLERQLQKARQHPTAEADQAEDVEADSRTPSALEGTRTFLERRLKDAQAAAEERPACTTAAQDVEKAKADLEDVHRQLRDSKDPDEKIRAKKRRLRNLSSKQARLLDTINKAMDEAEGAEKKQLEAQAEHAAARVEKEQLENELAELEAATAALKPPDVQGVSNAVETLVNDVAKKLLTPGLPAVLAQDGKPSWNRPRHTSSKPSKRLRHSVGVSTKSCRSNQQQATELPALAPHIRLSLRRWSLLKPRELHSAQAPEPGLSAGRERRPSSWPHPPNESDVSTGRTTQS